VWKYTETRFLLLSRASDRKGGIRLVRYIGGDLHKTNFVVCFLSEDDNYKLETFPHPTSRNQPFHIGVEQRRCGGGRSDARRTYYFYDQIKTYVGRIVLVDTYRFVIIASSKKKTDKADAQGLARFLKLDHLPEVPVPSKKVR